MGHQWVSRRRRTILPPLAVLAAIVGAQLTGTAASAATALTCPGGSYNLCIPAQGANEGVTGTAGSVVKAGYDFTVPGSDTTSVSVLGAYEQLTVSCANGATPTQSTISVPMPDATYTAPFPQSNGWVPSGNQSSMLTYEGSFTLGNYCNGGTIRVGQPGQMLFAAQVQSNGTSSLNFRSHYNDGSLSKSGSWSATKSVKPTPPSQKQTIQGEIYKCYNGSPTTTLVSGGTISVPAAGLSSANPLLPTQVPADTYTMNATAPSDYSFVACGQSGVTIDTPGTAHQSVIVPAGGAGDGVFYVSKNPAPTQTIQAEIYRCGEDGNPTAFLFNGGSITVTNGPSSPNPLGPTPVAAGTYTVTASLSPSEADFFEFVTCNQPGVTVSTPPNTATQQVDVPSGGSGDGKFYVTDIKK